MDKILEQGIFLGEHEMRQMVETRVSLYNKFTTTTFEDKDSIKSKMQTVKDFLKNVETNKKEYYSNIHVKGIFNFENDAPIENWFLNIVESLVGSTINLPTDWVQVIDTRKLIYGHYFYLSQWIE